MPVPIRAAIVGLAELQKVLAAMEAKVFRKATRKAVNAATKLVLDESRARVPSRTGSLKKSLGRKVVALKGEKKGYVGVVGPRKDLSERQRQQQQRDFESGKRKRPPVGTKFRRVVKYKGREILVNPVKYAHLVEYGTADRATKGKQVMSDGGSVFGVRTKGTPPRPFLRPAWDTARPACESLILEALRAAVTEAGK